MLSKMGSDGLIWFARTFLDVLPGLGQHNRNEIRSRLLKRLEALMESAIGESRRNRVCNRWRPLFPAI